MATQNSDAQDDSAQSAHARKTAFEARFPKLRLINQETSPTGMVSLSIAGTGADLCEAQFLTGRMIEAIPRCGVKHFHRGFDGGSGFSGLLQRTKSGFRFNAYFGEEVFGVFDTLSEIWRLPRARGTEEFESRFPGLRLRHHCSRLDAMNAALTLKIASFSSADIIRSDLATQAMLDDVRANGSAMIENWPGEDSDICIRRAPLGYYDITVRFDKSDMSAIAQVMRRIFDKTVAEPLSTEADIKATAAPLEKLNAIAYRMSPRLKENVCAYLARVEELLEMESERVAQSKTRPSYLRLVVDNEVRP